MFHAETIGDRNLERAHATTQRFDDSLYFVREIVTRVVTKRNIGPFARTKADPWHPNGDWIQDDLIDANAAWRMVQRVREEDLDTVVQEKQEAVDTLAVGKRVAAWEAYQEQMRGQFEAMASRLDSEIHGRAS